MSYHLRLTEVWKAALSGRTLDARIRLVPRAAAGLVALAFTIVAAGQLLAGRRLAEIEQASYPALRTTRTLAATLEAVRAQLAAARLDPQALDRADSLAERFHAVSRTLSTSSFASADSRFGDYYMVARAVAGASAPSPTAREASGLADSGYRLLAAQLADDAAATEQAIADGMASAAATQAFVTRSLVVAGISIVILLTLLGVAASASIDGSVGELAQAIDALGEGRLPLIPDRDTGTAGRVHDALRRLARQQHENADTALALAAGAYRRAMRTRPATDPVGSALGQLASSMDAIATVAHHVARGDLRGTVVPQSSDDAFGHAQLAMIRRLINSLTELETSRQGLDLAIEMTRSDAAALAAAASDDADRLRRTLERLAGVTVHIRAQAARGSALALRADESDDLLRQGAAALEESHAGLREVVRRSGTVQQLARNAGLLAVRAGTEGGSSARGLEDEARTLAAEAAVSTSVLARTVIDGTERVHETAVALDRVTLALHDGTSLVREVSAASRQQAEELSAIDEAFVQLHGTTTRRAESARELASRAESLSQHAHRFDMILRRFRGHGASRPAHADAVLSGPTLYHTPPYARAGLPTLAVSGL